MRGIFGDLAGNAIRGLGLTVLLTGGALLVGCDAHGEAPQAGMPPPPEVDVAQIEAGPVTLTETFTGRVEAPETVELRPRVTGYIEKVAFEEGELVEAGDLLFEIDPRPYQARVQAARAGLSQAQSELQLASTEADRAKRLMESRAISQEEYDQRQAAQLSARARVDAAEAALHAAELDLQYTRIVAPISGRAGRAMVTRGNLARADQTLLATVVSVDPMHVYFDSNEASAISSQALRGSEGPPRVRIGLTGEDGFPHIGTLDFVDNRLNPGTGTLRYRAVLPNPDASIKPGQFAQVEMPVARLQQALLVTRKAVLADQDRRYVYVVNGNDTVERRQVVAGREVGKMVVVREGLQAGERVIVNGTEKIFGPGTTVSPQLVAMDGGSVTEGATVAANAQ